MADLTAAGAAVGTAIFPGVGTAAGALVGGLLSSKSSAGGNSAPGPQDAHSAIYGDTGTQDNSGWNVNFSGTQSNGSNKAGQAGLSDAMGLSGIPKIYLIAGVLVIGLVLWKKSH